jgi:hypothetical protein
MSKSTVEDFILDHSRVSATGVRSVTKGDFLTYMADHEQLPEKVLDSYAAAEMKWIGGMVGVAADDLVPRIEAAKKGGDDPTELVSSVRVSRPNGQLLVDVHAQRTPTNPRTGERVVQHGVVSVKVRTKGQIPEDAAAAAQAMIHKLMS